MFKHCKAFSNLFARFHAIIIDLSIRKTSPVSVTSEINEKVGHKCSLGLSITCFLDQKYYGYFYKDF